MVENAFEVIANRFGCLVTAMPTEWNNITSAVMVCCTFQNLMRTSYPGVYQMLLHKEDDQHKLVPGA